MYRIELAPGEETVFRTIEELAIGVRNGLVTPRCRIYHNASQKWLPIEFHPHYKKALAIPAARLAEAAASRPAEKPRFDKLSFVVAPSAQPALEDSAEPVDEKAVETGVKPAAEPGAAEPASADPVAAKSSAGKRVVEPTAAEPPAAKRTQLERVRAPRPLAGQSNAEHRVAARQTVHRAEKVTGQHPVASKPTTDPTPEHAGAERLVEQPAVAQRPVAQQSVALQPIAQKPVAQQPASEHPAPDPWPSEPSVTESSGTHPAAADHSPAASHAPVAPETPAHPEPAPGPARSIVPWDRPDSYLPTTVRIVADDPYVAIAPAPAIAPQVEARPAAADPVTPPWMREAPALELPNISYPEITPAEEPVSEPASGSRGRRPLQVAIAVLVLATGGYLAKSFYSPVRGGDDAPAPSVADRPALPSDASAPADGGDASTPSTSPAATTARTGTTLPAHPGAVTPAAGASSAPDLSAPASSGFAAALEPRAMASGPLPKLPYAGAGVAPASPTNDSTAAPAAIAPPPAQMQIDVPSLPGSVPLVPTASEKGDSAMKRILRAVTNGKDPKRR